MLAHFADHVDRYITCASLIVKVCMEGDRLDPEKVACLSAVNMLSTLSLLRVNACE